MVAGLSISRLLLLAVFLWLIVLIYIAAVLVKVQNTGSQSGGLSVLGSGNPSLSLAENALNRIKQAAEDVQKLKEQNLVLEKMIKLNRRKKFDQNSSLNSVRNKPLNGDNIGNFPMDSLIAQRAVANGVLELGYKISGDLRKLGAEDASLRSRIDPILTQIIEEHNVLSADLWRMSELNLSEQLKYDSLQNMSRVVQKRIRDLQNPKDCNKARKLLCHLNKGCGFGCQVHHAAYCFIVAYSTERTLILESSNWRYSTRGWSAAFLPVSDKCTNIGQEDTQTWKGILNNQQHKVVSLPIVDSMRPRISQLPMSFPEEFANDLTKLHGNPPVWWIGQFMSYLMRFNPEMTKLIEQFERKINLEYPFVGIHVRRTDKVGAEASFHSIDEYMQWAMRWFDILDLKTGVVNKRRVYLATDDTNLVEETRLKYGSVLIYGDVTIAHSAQLSSRYSEESLRGVIIDIWLLSKAQYLVCTFSSQVCRISYELMQSRLGDAADKFHSLDDLYYFGGQQGHEQIAWLAHKPGNNKEIALEVGDVLGVAGNHWDGYSKGINRRTGLTGLYPSYKVREKWRVEKFPTYDHRKV